MPPINETERPWSDAVIMVCSKCFTRVGSRTGALQSVEDVKGHLKSTFKRDGFKGKVRVVISSCLDICPENKLAVVIAHANKTPAVTALEVDFDTTQETLFQALREKI